MRRLIQHIQQSLALKLSFGITLLAIPIFVASLSVLIIRAYSNIKDEAKDHAVSVLNTTIQRLEGYLETVETATDINEWLITANLKPDSLLAYSARIVMLNANVSGCSITTEPYIFPQYGKYFSAYTIRQGDSIVTVREGIYEYFEKTWYATPRKLGKPCWVDPFDDYNEGTLSAPGMIASYCRPLYDGKGNFIGVIASDVSLSQLSRIINTEKPYPNAYFVLLGQNGHYFVHPDTTRLVNKTIFDNPNPEAIALGKELKSGKQGVAEMTLDDELNFVCYKSVPGTKWHLLLVCPERDVMKSYNALKHIILPLLAVGLILILLFIRWIVNHATNPLRKLLKQAQFIEAGNYDERIAHTNRRDVIGRLQNSFSTMQESLLRHFNDIQSVNAETKQRNEELAKANQMVEEAGRQKTAFIQNMTHQIRTPLNIILGSAQVLRDNANDLSAEDKREFTTMMDHNAKSLSRMLLMLYDSSDTGHEEELKTGKQEEVSCNEMARQSIFFAHQHFPDLPIAFESSLPDDFCIKTSHIYLVRSLREILYNSAKYSDGKNISLHISEKEDVIRFVLQDTGTGIADSDREIMFTPFAKVNDLSEGLGLGLHLAKRHITFLGGRLIIDPDYHDGCRVLIEMPKQ